MSLGGQRWFIRGVATEVRCVFSRRLKVANVLDSGQYVPRSGKTEERLPKCVVQKRTHKIFSLADCTRL